ncbi:MAG: LytTR family DNA-binding domain-containing protein [Pseudomonadota bacterium]|nr:LytTR family DNA-binding domain-containing protein [Pseudomonadota bacterium]
MDIVIVEDSRLARKELLGLLKDYPMHRVVGEAGTVADAKRLVESLQPDLLLLDINLPDGSGFDLLERSEFTPQVIFTTAYEQHALQAFTVNALDYLLKPVTAERLAQALHKFAQQQASRQQHRELHVARQDIIPSRPTIRSPGEHLFVRDGERCHFVKYHEISLLEVDGNYVKLFFRDTRAMLARSMQYVEERLDPALFFRANRQQIVNLNYVAAIEPWIGDGLMIRMQDGREVDVSRRQARELKQRLEL